MNEMQLALVIVAIGVVAALLLYGRRGRDALMRKEPSLHEEFDHEGEVAPAVPVKRTAAEQKLFDEFGVGRPRRLGGMAEPATPPQEQAAAVRPPVAKVEPAPVSARSATPGRSSAPEKIITLFIAEKEGTKIFGSKIHAALGAQKLTYNDKNKCYDRVDSDHVLFSVTSLTAPGHLDRAKADVFATPGLALFLRLPGPPKPVAALKNLLATADALSKALNAVLFDADHQPLTNESLRRLSSDVEDWARKNPS